MPFAYGRWIDADDNDRGYTPRYGYNRRQGANATRLVRALDEIFRSVPRHRQNELGREYFSLKDYILGR